MQTLPVTLGDPNPQTTLVSTFCVAFHIFVVGELRLQFWFEGWS